MTSGFEYCELESPDEEFCDCLSDESLPTSEPARGPSSQLPNGRLTATNLPSLVCKSTTTLANPSSNETAILAQLSRLEEALEKFQHAVGHSLTAIDNDLCRLETRVAFIERGHTRTGRTKVKRTSSTLTLENLMTFNCAGNFENLAGGAISLAAGENSMLFIGTAGGTIEAWNVGGNYPSHLQSVALANVIDDSLILALPHTAPVCASALAVITTSRSLAQLYAGLTDGRVAVFKVDGQRQNRPLSIRQIWPETDFHTSGLHLQVNSLVNGHQSASLSHATVAPIHCIATSRDGRMLAIGRESELSILNVDYTHGIHSATFVHTFLSELAETLFDETGEEIRSRANTTSNGAVAPLQRASTKVNAVMFDDDTTFCYVAVGYRRIEVFAKLCLETHVTWRSARSLYIPMEIADISITSLVMAGGNRLILAGGSNGKLYIFERATDQHYRRIGPASSYGFSYSLLGHTASINSIATLGTTYPLCVLTASTDSTIRVWHWHANDREMVSAQVLERHKSDVTQILLLPTSNDNIAESRLFSISTDKTVKFWIPSATLMNDGENSTWSGCSQCRCGECENLAEEDNWE